MNIVERLTAMRDVVQKDVGNRGLARDPQNNLLTACPHDFLGACRDVAETKDAVLGIVTGFYIPTADPPAGETDGPLGAVYLARALVPLGIDVMVFTDPFCQRSLEVALKGCGLADDVPVLEVPRDGKTRAQKKHPITHLVALERVGPSHTEASVRKQPGSTTAVVESFLAEVPEDHHDRCHTMRGRDITDAMLPAHRLFKPSIWKTIGIGDGGNEIGMGKVPWDTIRRNIPGGALVACRVPTDRLIVAGVSNWGAYALAAGVAVLRGKRLPPDLFDPERERAVLEVMVKAGPLVDGVTGKVSVSVDGLSWDEYAKPFQELAKLAEV
jgi:hypothetical protein